MDRSADKSSKNETSLKFERGPQSSNLDDSGAYISFDRMGSIERLLRIKFGYESSGYEYSRDIFLDFEKVVELKKHLDSMIEYVKYSPFVGPPIKRVKLEFMLPADTYPLAFYG